MINLSKIRARIGRALRSDETGLIILAVSATARAYSYTPWKVNQQRTPVHWLESFTTPMVWGGVWATIAALIIASIFRKRLIPIAVGMVIFMHAAWFGSFMAQTIFGESARAWVTAISYGTLAALTMWAFSRAYPTIRFDLDKKTKTIPPRE
ncbi:hypothetical protein AY551_01255 [Corynebacterium diphtheriae bv. gravis]|uniref:hypothetical protein n=1 Tax=Corynebacterium diphtheriae TaxID=1717 RepID=UPI000893A205|nr:hypothetical protein [Corynebacterium diphtheriae]OFI51544.1 hypothetical protein BKD82_10335 [Corynebacterium diphtheriae]OWN69299.1 hypothetical protein AY518_03110 [Corynebacterium diphtheriae bv. gravis]OWO50059.1 hypothetical protein AY551_01255 [Corynebacterium diphtheriae bv. gravis]CAB0507153.1 hypothetical protein CIP107506_01143 [Corynebacterium diphtheriae]CAB0577354.1 hypothetical protein CIP107532_02564 [Corynebacterium diphtheriae]